MSWSEAEREKERGTNMLTRWSPLNNTWREFHRLHDEMNRLFGRYAADRDNGPAFAVSYPALNVWEDANHIYVEAELPGMEMNDLEIVISGDNQLSLKGERKPPELDNATWHRQERGFGAFSRVITLPIAVNADRVSAEFQHGVLTITLPKNEAAKPRRIPIKGE
jgi:HSP20 family protein